MGWQGRMREAKARRLFDKLPEKVKEEVEMLLIRCWRDNQFAWIFGRDKKTRVPVIIRVNRKTGAITPVEVEVGRKYGGIDL